MEIAEIRLKMGQKEVFLSSIHQQKLEEIERFRPKSGQFGRILSKNSTI